MYDEDHALLSFKEPLGELFLTEQMSCVKIYLKGVGKRINVGK
jgi:hypothetical protein